MKVKHANLIVFIFLCITEIVLPQRVYACWNAQGWEEDCHHWCCCEDYSSCDNTAYKKNCSFLNTNPTSTNPYCTFNFYCVFYPFYCLCPVGTVLNNDETKLDVLRATRDTRMARTALGRSLIKLYYKNSLEITSLLLADEKLLSYVAPVVDEIAEKALALNNGEKVSIDHALIEDILVVADLINEKASPELQSAIKRVRKQIKSGYIFMSLGFTVNT
jgi:hypothetical protein